MGEGGQGFSKRTGSNPGHGPSVVTTLFESHSNSSVSSFGAGPVHQHRSTLLVPGSVAAEGVRRQRRHLTPSYVGRDKKELEVIANGDT
ncbi:hypothetical protein E2C01_095958 [Portunus trituberculatus]|uniref:Uncharacterized protein n=1 Tax=Portunus trituberculatus TaxID=210409 RepID=A0A5B7K701_PORTR|nr:hypothetical protein [Portunus trituberculatus]